VKKAYFFGYIVNLLLNTALGRRETGAFALSPSLSGFAVHSTSSVCSNFFASVLLTVSRDHIASVFHTWLARLSFSAF
jgi:hypothetical protein